MEYTAVIRTLGTAGEKFQILLNSLEKQTIPPKAILVYIAEGYPLPKETIGKEQYTYVKKGMVAQRALKYKEVKTEYILFLDDDLYLSETLIEEMFDHLFNHKADIISPNIFPNSERPLLSRIMMTISGRMLARKDDGKWAYKVMRNSGYSYNINPQKDIYYSESNAGACFICNKEAFLKIHLEDEIWMDQVSYAIGDDQVMFYKMHLMGFKQLTFFSNKIDHLDAGNNLNNETEKKHQLIYSDFRYKVIFWHRFIYKTEKRKSIKLWDCLCIGYVLSFTLFISIIKLDFNILSIKYKAITDAIKFIHSKEYNILPSLHLS